MGHRPMVLTVQGLLQQEVVPLALLLMVAMFEPVASCGVVGTAAKKLVRALCPLAMAALESKEGTRTPPWVHAFR